MDTTGGISELRSFTGGHRRFSPQRADPHERSHRQNGLDIRPLSLFFLLIQFNVKTFQKIKKFKEDRYYPCRVLMNLEIPENFDYERLESTDGFNWILSGAGAGRSR